MAAAESLELRTVLERFDESSTALDELRDRLRGLAAIQDEQRATAESTRSSAERLSRFLAEVETATATLQQSVTAARDALIAAQQFLAGTDLSQVHTGVAGLTGTVERLAEEQATASTTLADVHRDVVEIQTALREQEAEARRLAAEATEQLRALEAEHAALKQRHEVLATKIAAMPERARRKAGL